MTESEVVEKLKAYHKCQRLQVKGIYEDCNEKLCGNCDLCYMQGTAGEHIKSIEIAIKALEKKIQKKPIFTEDKQFALCPCCDMKGLTDKQKYCDNCGQKLDWGDEE